MQIFYAPEIIAPGGVLSAEESAHAVRVLRLGAGAIVRLVDGRGNLHEARIVDPSPRGCRVEILNTFADFGHRATGVTVAVAPTKNADRLEWFLEKATEIGLRAVVPIECANSERRVLKPERAAKVLVSAMKQSLKAYLPELQPLTPVDQVFDRPFDGVKLIAHCRAEGVRIPITEALPAGRDALILIGPEGDFTSREVARARANGFIEVSLGESRLRTETAALVTVTAFYLKNL